MIYIFKKKLYIEIILCILLYIFKYIHIYARSYKLVYIKDFASKIKFLIGG